MEARSHPKCEHVRCAGDELQTPKRTDQIDLEELESKVALDVEELVDSAMGAAGEASSSSSGAMACIDECAKELVEHGVVSAKKD